jgi:hypothetical protein
MLERMAPGFSNVEGLELVKQAEEALLWQRKVHKGASFLFLEIKTPFFLGKVVDNALEI